ncbi:RluA family pseudouridine synthase [Pelotomaculum isophthalicicum JI]|uniref:Pseudouridine synthase n=1 Tax=Pelotomaculum isophthalicicum JI TaxID=947010 RepID=A0A9X4H3D8_9FIRM|nr:RluA family pseudouridine synthase [Pelotomaculum isophthalicicum]MDF9409591.1 RluA family pseudouridine synthase [Pelotomaculum isophthalicicum JI]
MKLSYQVTAADAGLTAERIMQKNLGFSRTTIRKLKRLSGVVVNGQAAYLNKRLQEGDQISVNLRFEEYTNVLPQPIPIEIAYEDEHLLIVNKPHNMLVHPLKHEPENTLANAILYHFDNNTEPVFRPLSRLDRNTSGLVVVAKHAHAGFRLAQQLSSGELWREYLAVVGGFLEQESGSIDLPIGRCKDSKVKRMVCPDGRRAITYYQVKQYLADSTLARLRLVTGRTHQIRVHMSHIGHPLVGDALYGGRMEGINRQALHCCRVGMKHPITGNELIIDAPIPEDMRRLILS